MKYFDSQNLGYMLQTHKKRGLTCIKKYSTSNNDLAWRSNDNCNVFKKCLREITCITKWNVKQWKQINEKSSIYIWCVVLFQHKQSNFPIMVHNWCKKNVNFTQIEKTKERVRKLSYPTLQHCWRMLHITKSNSMH